MIKLKNILNEAKVIINTEYNTDAKDQFKKLMKKSDFPNDSRFNLSTVQGWQKYRDSLQKWFASNISSDQKVIKLCMKPYEFKIYSGSAPTISYKGKKYKLSTEWDSWDYLFDVLVDLGIIKYKKIFDVQADRERRKKELMAQLSGD